jgi:5-methylcytosine-specific restriction endonuclease McrA
MTMDEFDRFGRAVEAVRRRRGRGTTLNQCLDLLTSTFLTLGSGKDGSSSLPAGGQTAPFTQVIYRCETCERAEVQTRKGTGGVSDETLRLAACDSVILRDGKRVRREIPVAVSRFVWTRARGCCESCGQRGWLHLHHRNPVEAGGKHSAENLVLLCSACHRAEHRGQRGSAGATHSVTVSRSRTAAKGDDKEKELDAMPGRPYPRGYGAVSPSNATGGKAGPHPRRPATQRDNQTPPGALAGGHTRTGMQARE